MDVCPGWWSNSAAVSRFVVVVVDVFTQTNISRTVDRFELANLVKFNVRLMSV
jgi:hypothetical protein